MHTVAITVSFLESGLTFVSTVKPDSRKDTEIVTYGGTARLGEMRLLGIIMYSA
jgi:hypothetical protein